MNILTKEMRRSLKEMDLGLKGELTITNDMEDLGNSLFFDQVPPSWSKRAYASLNGLSNWYADLILRIKELEAWTSDFSLPASVWLPGFFNPQSFLTAIMQSTGKSLSETLIFASTNPKYDDRFFIDLPVQYMKTTSSEHIVYINCFGCQNKNKFFFTQHVLSLQFHVLNDLLSYCWLVDTRISASEKDIKLKKFLSFFGRFEDTKRIF